MNKISIKVKGNKIIINSTRELSLALLNEFFRYEKVVETDLFDCEYVIDYLPYNCFVLLSIITKFKKGFEISTEDLESLKEKIMGVEMPTAYLIGNDYMGIKVPSIPAYMRLMTTINARNVRLNMWTVPIGRVYNEYRILKSWSHSFLPNITFEEGLEHFISEKLRQTENLENLYNIELKELTSAMKGWKVKPEGFSKLKYDTAVDLLLKRPRYYKDRTTFYMYKECDYGKLCAIRGKVKDFVRKMNACEILVSDGKEEKWIKFYSGGHLNSLFPKGTDIIIEVIRVGGNKYNGVNFYSTEEVDSLPILPVYSQSAKYGITSKVLINCIDELLKRFNGEDLINYSKNISKPFWKLIEELHFPKNVEEYSKTLDDLAYIELLFLQTVFLDQKKNTVKSTGISKMTDEPIRMNTAIKNLPYQLTNGQKKAIKHSIEKMKTNQAEDILLSGDVGAGKSVVAQSLCLYNVDCGYQAVLIGPTEILAQQLYNTLLKFISTLPNNIKPNVAYLSGATKKREKEDILRGVKSGHIHILVGTHGVFSVDFNNLGLIIIDEQQKFGAEQRSALLHSRSDSRIPDLIAQTATPIPRSTALAFYGNIDLITLDEKPGNRKENITKWIKQNSEDFLRDLFSPEWEHIFSELEQGRQMFIVTPAVEESEKKTSVKSVSKILEKRFDNKIRIAEIHGQMKKEQQNKIMQQFRNKEIDVIVASTIVEVGVDIPNATIMLVLDAHYFGASSLHQIRGRVGRSELQGYCYLVSDKETKNAYKRLQSLVDSNDGFQIALVDLETRKEGDLLGTRQSGESSLVFCDLADHSKLIDLAKQEAEELYNSDLRDVVLADAKIFLKKKEGDYE